MSHSPPRALRAMGGLCCVRPVGQANCFNLHNPLLMLPTANPAILFKQMDDGAVLFSPGTEIYFGLNEVGARIWQLLPEAGGSLGALCARLSSEYPGVPLDTIRRDVEELLGELVNEGLAAPAASSASDASTDAASTP